MVDGGKGQLAVASALLRTPGIELDHLGIAKERDVESPSPRVKRSGGLKAERVFLPNRREPGPAAAELRGRCCCCSASATKRIASRSSSSASCAGASG